MRNALQLAGKQLVLTSDKPPVELKDIEQRLLTRFKWGLSAPLNTPDYETKVKIIRAKAQKLGAQISEDVVTFLADNISANVREIEGALSSLVANASFLGRKITTSLAKEILKVYVQLYQKEITIDHIIQVVCDYLNLDFARFNSTERTREIAQARQIAMYLAKQHTKAPLTTIGAAIGGRNHATVLHSCKAVTNLLETDKAFRRQVEEMLSVCDGYLKRSKFADARAALQRYAIPSASVSSCISDAEAVLRNSVGMTPVYERVEPVGRAKEKISSIRRLEDEVRALEAEADRNASELSEKLAKVDDYEAKYPEYKKLRREFDLAGTLREKRELRLKLLDYTMEELPELELEHVRATIDAFLEKRGGFFKKKSVLKFTVTIEKNRELPCDAELHIATRALTSAEDRMCYIYEIPKGTEGQVSGEVELPQRYIEAKKTINLYLFPAEDVLDKKAVTADFKYIKQ